MFDRARKLGFVFLVLGLAVPFVTHWLIEKERVAYEAKFGLPPEGMGLFALIGSGALVMLGLLLAAAIYATKSIRRSERPRLWNRWIELAAFYALPICVLLFIMFVLLGIGSTPPLRIQKI